MWPLWIFILILVALIVAYFVIKAYSPEAAGMIMSFIKKYGFVIIVIIGYFLFRDYLGYFDAENDWLARKANTYLIFSILGWMVYTNFIGNARYHTNQIICRNGFHGSVAGPPILTKDGFAIFSIGAILWGIHLPWGDKTLVLRTETYSINGSGNYVSIARPVRYSLSKLPPEEKETIKSIWSLNKNSVFYGWFDDVEKLDFPQALIENLKQMKNKGEMFGKLFDIENPKVEILLRHYINLSAAYNKLQEQHDAATDSIEGFDEHIYRRRKVWERGESKHEETEETS